MISKENLIKKIHWLNYIEYFWKFREWQIDEKDIHNNLILFIENLYNKNKFVIKDVKNKLSVYGNDLLLFSINLIKNDTSKAQFLKLNLCVWNISEYLWEEEYYDFENSVLLKICDKDNLYNDKWKKKILYLPTSWARQVCSINILKWIDYWNNIVFFLNNDKWKIQFTEWEKIPYNRETLFLDLYRYWKKYTPKNENEEKEIIKFKEDSKLIIKNLKDIIKNDINEAQQCFDYKLYKWYAVLCWSIVEWILNDWYEEISPWKKDNNMTLELKINWFLEKWLIEDDIHDYLHYIRKTRNIIHPNRHLNKKELLNDIKEWSLLDKIKEFFKFRIDKLEEIIN